MISSMVTVGLVLTLVVSLVLPMAGIVYCIRKGGTKGTPMLILMGLVGYMLTYYLPGILNTVIPMDSIIDESFVLYLLLATLIIAVIDGAVRFLTVQLSGKQGFGLYKGLALGVGYAAGNVLMQASIYFQTITYVNLINDGTFVSSMVEQGAAEADVAAYQESMIALNPASYLVTALEKSMLVFLNVAVILFIISFFAKGKKILGIIIAASVRFVFEFLSMLVYYLATDNMDNTLSQGTSLILTTILYAIVLAGCIYLMLRLMKSLPKEAPAPAPEPFGAVKSRRQEEEKKQSRKAWSEVTRLNTRNIDKE